MQMLQKILHLILQTTGFSEFSRPFRARGFSNLFTPDSEGTLPPREFLFSQDKQRPNPLVKGIFGINMFEKDEDYGQFFKQLGYTEWKLGSRSKIPTQKKKREPDYKNYTTCSCKLR